MCQARLAPPLPLPLKLVVVVCGIQGYYCGMPGAWLMRQGLQEGETNDYSCAPELGSRGGGV